MTTQNGRSGVTVVAPKHTVNHPNGDNIYISDGHLFVAAANSAVLAIYAPGQWLRVFDDTRDVPADVAH